MKVEPLRDRVLAYELPPRDPGVVLDMNLKSVSTTHSGVRMKVTACGSDVKEVSPGDIVFMARKVLLNIGRTHEIDGQKQYMIHEGDFDAIELG